MNAKEALRIVTSKDGKVCWAESGELLNEIEVALREKVAREEKPKRPSLEEQEAAIAYAAGCIAGGNDGLQAALVTTKTLRVRGGRIVHDYYNANGAWDHAIRLLLDLGVVPAPAP